MAARDDRRRRLLAGSIGVALSFAVGACAPGTWTANPSANSHTESSRKVPADTGGRVIGSAIAKITLNDGYSVTVHLKWHELRTVSSVDEVRPYCQSLRQMDLGKTTLVFKAAEIDFVSQDTSPAPFRGNGEKTFPIFAGTVGDDDEATSSLNLCSGSDDPDDRFPTGNVYDLDAKDTLTTWWFGEKTPAYPNGNFDNSGLSLHPPTAPWSTTTLDFNEGLDTGEQQCEFETKGAVYKADDCELGAHY